MTDKWQNKVFRPIKSCFEVKYSSQSDRVSRGAFRNGERGTVWLAVRSKRLLPPNSNNNNPPTLAQRADRNSNTVRNSNNNSKQGVARKQ
ncbi:UNVERIFIED_CONTAM: hypothetical protein Slati_0406400 [Sesamum latifolium]|uniref:Uncharacterized protein n=1 Tax=Sesamum latifolium TaxID=2727402 RepID=A0AAW2XUZ7_9LAMI